MAECLLLLGNPGSAGDILLHLEKTSTPDFRLMQPRESEIRLTCRGKDGESNVLWRLFVAATAGLNDVLSVAVAEKLFRCRNESEIVSDYALCAYVFSLLQGQQAQMALDLCRKLAQQKGNHGVAALLALYEADAGLVMDSNCAISGNFASSVASSAAFLVDSALKSYNMLSVDVESDSQELGSAILNNKGISLLLQGNAAGATECFRDAVNMSKMVRRRTSHTVSLQPYFNLALVRWRQREFEDAYSVWLQVRGLWFVDGSTNDVVNFGQLQQSLDESMVQLLGITFHKNDK